MHGRGHAAPHLARVRRLRITLLADPPLQQRRHGSPAPPTAHRFTTMAHPRHAGMSAPMRCELAPRPRRQAGELPPRPPGRPFEQQPPLLPCRLCSPRQPCSSELFHARTPACRLAFASAANHGRACRARAPAGRLPRLAARLGRHTAGCADLQLDHAGVRHPCPSRTR